MNDPVLPTVNVALEALVMAGAANAANVAVTLLGAFITMFCGSVKPPRSPVNPVNRYPAFAVAVTGTEAPESNHPEGVTVPPPAGLALVVNWYCVENDAV
jgi:hypothetical protein